MNECINKWTTNLSSLSDSEFDEFLDHAETCQFHAGILDEYESETLPFIELAFSDCSEKAVNQIASQYGMSTLSEASFHNYKETSFTLAPLRLAAKGRSIEEEIISAKYKEILKSGFTPENCRKALEVLEKNNSVVQNSWSNTLDKARVLAVLEETNETEKILKYVLEKYSCSREAIGNVYEVFSWLEELNYHEEDKISQKSLDRRMDYINKGLKVYPDRIQLWINAFETACLKNYTSQAISYLNRMEKIDNQIARQYVSNSPIKEEISKSDISLRKEIIRLNPNVKIELV